MKRAISLFLLLALPFFLVSQAEKKVLIIGIDGCRPDALQAANTPNLDALISKGIYSPDALNDDITISGPGWSAILCGVWSGKHLVTGNDFSNNNYAEYPPLFKYVEDYNPIYHTVSICHWGPINDFIVQDYADFKLNVSSDEVVASQAADYFSVNDPDVVFLHFDDVDHAGHNTGFSPTSSEYLVAIESVDAHIGAVLDAIELRPNFPNEDWLILVSTDHGGLGTSHGGNSLQEQNVFLIATSPSILPELILKDSTIVLDTVFNCLGDTIELQFDGDNDRVQIAPNPLFDFGADQDFTVECRVRTDQSGDVAIVGNKDWDSGLNKGFVFSFKYPSGPEWKVNIGDGNNRADINTGGTIADNDWHTLSVTFDRDGWMKMFEDGILLDSVDITAVGDITTNQGLFFGTDILSEYDFSGSIAEVRIWNGLLNDQTIADWQCVSPDANHPNYNALIGYWKLNEGASSLTATDLSGNGNNGTIIDATWNTPESSVVAYDYSLTPRLTDIVPTALAHLCILVDPSWGLDGNSLIPECGITNGNSPEPKPSQPDIRVLPNPSGGSFRIELDPDDFGELFPLEIYDITGRMVYGQLVATHATKISAPPEMKGVYLLRLRSRELWITHRLVIH